MYNVRLFTVSEFPYLLISARLCISDLCVCTPSVPPLSQTPVLSFVRFYYKLSINSSSDHVVRWHHRHHRIEVRHPVELTAEVHDGRRRNPAKMDVLSRHVKHLNNTAWRNLTEPSYRVIFLSPSHNSLSGMITGTQRQRNTNVIPYTI